MRHLLKNILDRVIAYGFIGLMIFSALAHGAVEPWSELIFVVSIAGLGMLWTVRAMAARRLVLYVPQTLWPLLAFTLLGAAQSIAYTDGNGYLHSLSSDVEATRGTVLMLCCLLAAGLVAANFLTHRERLWRLALALTFFGVALSTFALIQHFTWSGRFFWFRAAYAEAPFGPFVNRNHFAGYLELLLPWPVIVMLSRRRWEEKFFYGFAAAWITMTAVFSQSRGGMVSILAQLIFLAAFSLRGAQDEAYEVTRRRQIGAFLLRAGAVGALVAALAVGVNWLGNERVSERVSLKEALEKSGTYFSALSTYSGNRLELWRDGWALFRAQPLTGAGLGAFQTVFPAFNKQDNPGLITSQVHNDYLQVLTDGGIIGGMIALWFLGATCVAIRRGIRSREPMMNFYALGCGAGILGLLVHSLFDFNLQLPSHALLFIAFSAIAAQLRELAERLAEARVTARPIADARRILLARKKREV